MKSTKNYSNKKFNHNGRIKNDPEGPLRLFLYFYSHIKYRDCDLDALRRACRPEREFIKIIRGDEYGLKFFENKQTFGP